MKNKTLAPINFRPTVEIQPISVTKAEASDDSIEIIEKPLIQQPEDEPSLS